MSTKAMKLALEALEGLKSIPGGRHELHELNAIHRKHDRAITALRKALAEQPAQQEPFGYFKAEPFGWIDCAETDEGAVALYTTPQPAQRKPLTLGQKQRLWSSVGDKPTLKDRVNAYGLAIEAAHNIKENT